MMSSEETLTFDLDGPYLDILSLRQKGFCCSQIIVKLALRALGRENPDMVRSMAALCFGTNADGVCGILTGAACALSLSLGGNKDDELPDPMLPLLLGELCDWFSAAAERSYGGIRCVEILTASPDKRACSLLLVSTLEKLQTITAAVESAARVNNHGCS